MYSWLYVSCSGETFFGPQVLGRVQALRPCWSMGDGLGSVSLNLDQLHISLNDITACV